MLYCVKGIKPYTIVAGTVTLRGYPREFWDWAKEHGLTPRGPIGSVQNWERKGQIPELYKAWVRLQKGAKDGGVRA